MKFGLIGCGLIGFKRAQAGKNLGFELTAAADLDLAKAQQLCERFGGKPYNDPQAVLDSQAQMVVVAVTHDHLASAALLAAQASKHILIEKPGARTAAELKAVALEAQKRNLIVKVGYNHRFHPSFLKAKELVDQGLIGPLLYVRGRYGHGGRVGYEKEWRLNKQLSGGGELLDQGSHLLDLAQWFLGDFSKVTGFLPNYFWNAPGQDMVEDNAFMLLTTPEGKCAFLHAAWTEWKNMFSFEITGRDGKLSIDGLGGSYGLEQLAVYKMLPNMGPPETVIHQYPFSDLSWEKEMEEMALAIAEKRPPLSGIKESVSVLSLIDELYNQQDIGSRS
jgi:predicted dehydrogenase